MELLKFSFCNNRKRKDFSFLSRDTSTYAIFEQCLKKNISMLLILFIDIIDFAKR